MGQPDLDRDLQELMAHEPLMRRVAWSVLGDADDVDDVVQQAWLAQLEQRRRARRPRALLGAVAHNLSVSLLRRKKRRRDVERVQASAAPGGDASDLIERMSFYRTAVEWILQMEEPYRTTLLLRYAEDLEPTEIARRTGVPASTVRVRLKRALARLRRRFRDEVGEERRGFLLAAIFGVGVTRERPRVPLWLVGGVAASVLVAALVVWRPAPEPRAIDEGVRAMRGEAGAAPRRRPPPFAADAPGEIDRPAAPAVAAAGDVIRGRVTILRGGVAPRLRLIVDAEPHVTGVRAALPGLPVESRSTSDPHESVARVIVENGAPLRLPVPEPGRYRLLVRAEGIPGGVHYQASTDREVRARLRVLEQVSVRWRPGSPRATAVRFAWPGDDGESAGRAGTIDEHGVVALTGPILPGLRLGARHPQDGRWWWCDLHRENAVLALPALGVEEPMAVFDAATDRDIPGATCELVWWGRDMRSWRVRWRGDATGLVACARPVERHPVAAWLQVAAEGHVSRRYVLAGNRPLPEDVFLEPRTVRRGVVRDGEGRPLADRVVVGCVNDEPRWRGITGDDGRFTARPFEPTRRLDAGGEVSWRIFGERSCATAVATHRAGRIELEAAPARSVTIRVRDVAGREIPEARASLAPFGRRCVLELARRVAGESGGRLDVGPLGGDGWLLEVTAPGYRPASLDLPGGSDPGEHVVVLEPADGSTRADVLAVDEHGDPVPWALALLSMPGGEPLRQTTDADGRAGFPLLAGVVQTVSVLAPGLAPSVDTPAQLVAGDDPMRVTLLPIEPTPIAIEGGGFVVCESLGVEGRRRTVAIEPGGVAALTRERQRLTLYRSGRKPCPVIHDPATPAGAASPEPGPVLRVTGLAPDDAVALRAITLTAPDGREAPIRPGNHFDVETSAAADRVDLRLAPGLYELVVTRDGKRVHVSRIRVDESASVGIRDHDETHRRSRSTGGHRSQRTDGD